MIKTFVMLTDSKIEPAATKGTTVYKCTKCDYGLASDDTRITGVQHISLTLKSDGDYPSFTHPVKNLEEVKVVTDIINGVPRRVLQNVMDGTRSEYSEAVVQLRALLAPVEQFPHDSPLHKAVFMALESYGTETFEQGVMALIKQSRELQAEIEYLELDLEGQSNVRRQLAELVGVSEEPRWKWILIEVSRLKALSVTNIMLNVVPGEDGMGEEIYAKSVADVEAKFSKFVDDIEELEALRRWRDLALQFDNHRMQALWHLKNVCTYHDVGMVEATAFLSQPPLAAHEVVAERDKLREALTKIAAIEDRFDCGDWDEIEEARNIANAALTH